MHEYEDRVCQTGQPPAADVSFAGAKKNQAYCDAVQAGERVGRRDRSVATKWSIDGVRSFVTSDEFAALAAKAKANAPAEIKADVIADTDWQLNEQADVHREVRLRRPQALPRRDRGRPGDLPAQRSRDRRPLRPHHCVRRAGVRVRLSYGPSERRRSAMLTAPRWMASLANLVRRCVRASPISNLA